MKPTKPFLLTLALIAVGAAAILPTGSVRAAETADGMQLSTPLTPEIIDYFGLSDAYARPSIAALVQCHASPACGNSDSSRVRFVSESGAPKTAYDDTPTTTIEQVRRQRSTPASGVTETRTLVRRYTKDAEGRIVMNGLDSIVKVSLEAPDRVASTLVRVHRYADVRYLVNDPTFVWPMTGLVVLELLHKTGKAPHASTQVASHAAVSFDGTPFAQIITTGALSHRVNLQAKILETIMPAR